MKRLLLFSGMFFLGCCALGLQAQNIDCTQRLVMATQLFEKGKLSQTIDSLQPCLLLNNQGRETRISLLNLAMQAYVFLDSTQQAEEALRQILDLDPFFEIDREVPELRYLRDRVITYPRRSFSFQSGWYALSVPHFSSNEALSEAIIDERLGRVRDLDQTLNADFGLNLAADWGYVPFPRSSLELHAGLQYSRYAFSYRQEMSQVPVVSGIGNAALLVQEQQRWLRVPIYASLGSVYQEEVVNKVFLPYASFGFSADFLARRSAKFRTMRLIYDNSQLPMVDQIDIPLKDHRRTFNLSAMLGIGAKVHLRRIFLLADVRYQLSLLDQIADPDQRLELPKFYFVDNSFRLHNLALNVGVGVFWFKARVRE
jgi:hypothetical protein